VNRPHIVVAGLIAGSAIAAWSQVAAPSETAIQPGLWKVTATMSGTQPPITGRRCLRPADAARGIAGLLLETGQDCSFTRSTFAGGKLDAALSCAPGTPEAMTVTITGSFSSKTYDATSTVTRDGNPPVTITAKGKWIGECSN
jgi:hypothetical protein